MSEQKEVIALDSNAASPLPTTPTTSSTVSTPTSSPVPINLSSLESICKGLLKQFDLLNSNNELKVTTKIIQLLTKEFLHFYYTNYGDHLNKNFIYKFGLVNKLLSKYINNESLFLKVLSNFEEKDNVNEFVITVLLLVLNKSVVLNNDQFYQLFSNIFSNITKANVKVQITEDVWFTIFEYIHKNKPTYLPSIIDVLDKGFKRSKQNIGPIISQFYQISNEFTDNSLLITDLFEMLKLRNEPKLVETAIGMFIHSVKLNKIPMKQHFQELLVLDLKTKQLLFNRIYETVLNQLDKQLQTKKIIYFHQSKVENPSFDQLMELCCDFFNNTPPMTENVGIMTTILDIIELLSLNYNLKPKNLIAVFQKVLKIDNEEMIPLKQSCLESISEVSIELHDQVETLCSDIIFSSEKKKGLRSLAIYCLKLLTDLVVKLNKDSTMKNINQNVKKFFSYLFTKETIDHLHTARDFKGLSKLMHNLLLNDKFAKIINNLSNTIKSDMYYCLSVCLSNNTDFRTSKWLSEEVKKSTNIDLIEQVFLDGFCNRLMKDLEVIKYNLIDKEENPTAKLLYPTTTLELACNTFRDCFEKNLKQLKNISSLYQLFIYQHHPLCVTNPRAFVHSEKYHSLLLHPVVDHFDDLLNFVVAKVEKETNEYLKLAYCYAISTLFLWKHTKNSHKVFDHIGEKLHQLNHKLFKSREYNQVDYIIYNKKNDEPHFPVDEEVHRHPLFRHAEREYMTEKEQARFYRYHLTDKDWEGVQTREKSAKKNLQEIRKQIVKEYMLKKEAVIREEIQQLVESISNYLQVLQTIANLTFGDKTKIEIISAQKAITQVHYHKFAWSSVLFKVTFLLDKYTYFPQLVKTSFNVLRQVNKNVLMHLDYQEGTNKRKNVLSNYGLSELLAIATLRLNNKFTEENPDTITRFIPGFDNNLTFGDFLIHKIRLQLPNMLEAEEFTCILPFLGGILNRKSIISKPEDRFEASTLTVSMSILSAHAGKNDLSGILRSKILDICVEEILPFMPHLNKQATNSMLAMAPYLDYFEPLIHALTFSSQENVRLSCLKTLKQYWSKGDIKLLTSNNSWRMKLTAFYSQFDSSEENAQIAKEIMKHFEYTIEDLKPFIDYCIPLITCDNVDSTYFSRNTSCLMLAGALSKFSSTGVEKEVDGIISNLISTFEEKQKLIKSPESFDPIITISWALQEITPVLTKKEQITKLLDFAVHTGLKPLDLQEQLREQYQASLDEVVNIGSAVVFNHGKKYSDLLTNSFNNYLTNLAKSNNDFAIGSIVVWLGGVAQHFEKSGMIKKAIDQLIDSLGVPSNTVQRSISHVLSPLISKIYEKEQDYVLGLINKLFDGILRGNTLEVHKGLNAYGVRRGYAWGLAGILYGCGLNDLYLYGIAPVNNTLSQQKVPVKAKEGSMLIYECLALRFTALFEPYMVEVIPNLLNYGLGESNKEVRTAAKQAINVIMAQLTPFGVVQLLPTVLTLPASDNWRLKASYIKLLGYMAFSAPRQLAAHLPTIISTLKETVNETHPSIVKASKKSLERVGGACKSPEISRQVPALLQAISNPEQQTIDKVLEALLFTRFTHSIDSASLALLMPVLSRALNERYTDIKKKACQIIGSISSLILEPKKDLLPYMTGLVPTLKNILLDPSPQVRASSAKAIGQLSKSVGEENMSELVAWLHEKLQLQGPEFVTERSGAAQALCEVISAHGVSRLQKSLPYLLSQIEGDNVQEGYLQVFVYLPALMKSQFEPFLAVCLPKILKALSHNKEGIRETALQSSRVIIELFTDSALNMLVPALREGLESEQWRTRYNCIILLNDLLARITIIYGTHTPMDENTPISLEVVETVLAKDLVAQIVALVFLATNDINLKLIANRLWKDMIPNTPNALKNLLPQLIDVVIKHLNKGEEQRFIAGKTLGELVAKLGEKVLAELVPILQQQLVDENSNPETRQGVMLGVTELMNASVDKHLYTYASRLIGIVKRGICDHDASVRDAASSAFDVLCNVIGERAVKEIVSQLLHDLEKSDTLAVEIASCGMQQLVRVRPHNVLPKLIPALLNTGESGQLSDIQLKTLRDVSSSVVEYEHDEEMAPYLPDIVEKLLSQLAANPSIKTITNADEEDILILETIHKVLQCLPLEECEVVLELLQTQLTSNDINTRRAVTLFAQLFFDPTKLNENTMEEEFITDHLMQFYEHLIASFVDPDDNVVKGAWYAIDKIVSKCLSKELHYHLFIQPTRESVRRLTQISSTGELIIIEVPAFNKIAKGIEPILTLYLHGLLFGKTHEVREESAMGIGDLIQLTNAKSLSPFVIKITGPLIRVLGDRFPWQVKAAILQTTSLLMEKGSIMLKPFLPQLQTTYIKGLQDASSSVIRKYSEQSLPKLIPLGSRIDSLVSALNVALKANGLSGKASLNDFVVSITKTLITILKDSCDQNKTKGVPYDQCLDTFKKILGLSDSSESANSILLKQTVQQDSDKIVDICSQGVAICCKGMQLQGNKDVEQFITQTIESNDNLYATLITLSYIAIDPIFKEPYLGDIEQKLLDVSSQTVPSKVTISLVKACTIVVLATLEQENGQLLDAIQEQFEKSANNLPANALRYETAKCIKKLVKAYRARDQYEIMYQFVEPLMQFGIKDKFVPARLCNERTLFYLLGFADQDQERIIEDYCKKKKLGAKEAKLVSEYGKVLSKLSLEDSDEEEKEEEERYVE
ncbi:hypothetical protein ABK040_004856 [Willaertia magna]